MTQQGLDIAFFGSSLVSAYWNGAATYYRGIIRALYRRGHRVTFYEPDAYERQAHRDIDDPDWAKVVVYPATDTGVSGALQQARSADVLIKASGVGVFDAFLETKIPELAGSRAAAIFWDVDAPATLARVCSDGNDYFRALISRYDLILTYGGGGPVVSAYEQLGAHRCVPIYNALDPDSHFPVPPDSRFEATLGFLGNRLPDREQRVDEFFFKAARSLPNEIFLLGGSGWQDKAIPANVRYVGHVYTRDHNSFNCTPKAVLNISRDSMASNGYSPATRVFEAAGAGACLITDAWQGIDEFLEPEQEVLLAHSGEQVVQILSSLSEERARQCGANARRKVLRHHTYEQRARELESVLLDVFRLGARRTAS